MSRPQSAKKNKIKHQQNLKEEVEFNALVDEIGQLRLKKKEVNLAAE